MGAAFACQQIAAIGGGQEILRPALDDPQPVLAELQVRNHFRVQEADGVGRHRIAKTGMELLGDRGAAHHLAALHHLHPQPRHCEIRRASEAVMPRADDDNFGFRHGRASRSVDQRGHSGMVRRETRNLEIPGSRAQRKMDQAVHFVANSRPGMTFLAKKRARAQRQVTILLSRRYIARRVPPCSIARARRLAGIAVTGARRVLTGALMTSPDPSAGAEQPSDSRNRLVLIVYTAAIFVSALLLFSVQPLFTKMVLSRLGGSPAVWSVAMVFFQSLLLGGYAYAHYLMRLRNRRIPVAVHLVLLIVALLTLPLSIASGWGEPPTSGYAFWLLGLFAVSIGLPFFALAANNPLLQAWFVRTGHPSGPDPYFLYASSNIGSLLAPF